MLERDVDLTALPATVPPRVRQVIAVCLRKDPRQRLQAMGDVRLALEGVFETAAPVTTIEAVAARRPLRLRVAPFAAFTAVAAAAIGVIALRPEPLPRVRGFKSMRRRDRRCRWARRPSHPTSGRSPTRWPTRKVSRGFTCARLTASRPRASRHGERDPPVLVRRWPVARFAAVPDNYLKSIDVDAGSARTLFNVTGPWHGTSNQDDIVLFPGGGGISRWANGQKPALELPLQKGETGTGFPFFLPDGKRFLVLVTSSLGTSIQLATLGSQARSVVVDAADGAGLMARTPAGKSYLLFVRTTDLLVQEFDEAAGVVRGSPKVLVTDVGLVANPPLRPTVGVSGGILAYQTGGIEDVAPLVWVNRSGVEVGRLTREASVRQPRLSPDGGRFLGSRFEAGSSDIWITDLRRGSSTRVTFSGPAFDGVWSADGAKVAYRRRGAEGVVVAGADGSGERRVADPVNRLWDWSPDGRMLLATVGSGFTLIRVDEAQKPIVLQAPSGRLREGRFSPNGNYIAFVSDETGRDEVYVQATPPATFRTKISINSGILPRWRADGKELFFVSPADESTMMAVDVDTGASFSADIPRPLFKTGGGRDLVVSGYAVRADGQQFLMPGRGTQAETWPITVVLNWWAELE